MGQLHHGPQHRLWSRTGYSTTSKTIQYRLYMKVDMQMCHKVPREQCQTTNKEVCNGEPNEHCTDGTDEMDKLGLSWG